MHNRSQSPTHLVAVAPYFLLFLVFSCRRLLPQRHTHGCHMDAMLKPRDRLAAPTAPVLQAGSPGIWLPDLFRRLFSRTTFPIKSHVTRWSVRSASSISSSLPLFS
jgi:hypothetical protein